MANSAARTNTFTPLLQDAENLISLHPSQTGTPGRPPGDTGPLLRSTVVLIHTAWENYVEQVALEGLEFVLMQIGDDHSQLHHTLRSRLGAIKNPWSLAGNDWQNEARRAGGGDASSLNTPNRENTEALLELAVGLSDALQKISWQKMSNQKVLTNLDEFVHDIRGEIVHKGATVTSLDKSAVKGWISFFERLTEKVDARLATHFNELFDAKPW